MNGESSALRGHKNAKLLVTRLIPKDETYHGEHAEEGSDLHVELDGYRMISFPLFATNGQVITQQIRGDSGCHRSEGVFIARGAGVRQVEAVSGANLMDLAPTILHLLGLPVRSEMDGRVLTEIMESAGPIRYAEAEPQASQETGLDAEDVEEHFRGLGYL